MVEEPDVIEPLKLKTELLKFLRDLLLEDRDQFFEQKRALEARGEPSIAVLRDIRTLEKILRQVDKNLLDLIFAR